MKESQYIRRWMNEGELKGWVKARRAAVLKVLRLRLHDPIPGEVSLALDWTHDLTTLDRWLTAAVQAETWADFLAVLKNGA